MASKIIAKEGDLMTGINGYGAYQNTMMNALQNKQKASADKTAEKAKETEKLRAARRNGKAEEAKETTGVQDKEVQLSDKAKALLDKGITINKVNGKETLLTIAPADGSYKVNFGKEEFETYFKNFLRPQLIEMLF